MSLTSGNKTLGDNATDTIISDIIIAVQIAVEQAISIEATHQVSKLAKKTGAMRDEIITELMNQLAYQAGNTKIILRMDKYRLSSVLDYIKEHWNSSPSGGMSYIQPSTPGTIPIFPKNMMIAMKQYTKQVLPAQFDGMNYRVTVS